MSPFGPVDIYDFHALEMMQCMAERRKGGETGVVSMQALRGDAVWDALAAGIWSAGGCSPRLFEACLCRSQTLAQDEFTAIAIRRSDQMKQWTKQPVCYRFEYADGLKAHDAAAQRPGQGLYLRREAQGRSGAALDAVLSADNPNVVYSAALMSKAEEMFLTGKAPYPVERTLLTSGLVAAGLQSLADGKKLDTPHLAIRYQAPQQSQFWQT